MGYFDADRVPYDGRPLTTPVVPRRRHRGMSARNHGPECSRNPEIGCVCGYDPGETAPADPTAPAGRLRPGQRVVIYGGAQVTVQSVEPDTEGDHDTPFVVLRYQWATDAHGEPMLGRWALPATQRLPLLQP